MSASTREDSRAVFANIGSCVDLFAPGDSIISSYVIPAEDCGSDLICPDGGLSSPEYTSHILSGTSMSAPHVAGIAARHLGENPLLTPAEVHQKIIQAATYSHLSDVGTGSPNRLAFICYSEGSIKCFHWPS